MYIYIYIYLPSPPSPISELYSSPSGFDVNVSEAIDKIEKDHLDPEYAADDMVLGDQLHSTARVLGLGGAKEEQQQQQQGEEQDGQDAMDQLNLDLECLLTDKARNATTAGSSKDANTVTTAAETTAITTAAGGGGTGGAVAIATDGAVQKANSKEGVVVFDKVN